MKCLYKSIYFPIFPKPTANQSISVDISSTQLYSNRTKSVYNTGGFSFRPLGEVYTFHCNSCLETHNYLTTLCGHLLCPVSTK